MLNEDAGGGQRVGRDCLFGFLRDRGLLVPRKKSYHKTTDSRHWMRKYPNTAKDIELVRPEQLWVADITYLRAGGGHYYLHLVTDAYSKKIVGHTLAGNMHAATTLAALRMAVEARARPGESLTHHSDRGLQYSSSIYTGYLRANGIAVSMTEESDPYENAVAERVNGILKDEFGLGSRFEDFTMLKRQVRESIELYNGLRPHMSVDMLTPEEAHRQEEVVLKKWKTKQPSKLVLKAVYN
jgi:transposase InsO family protein